MANEEHLARLRAGVDAWNAWRKEHPDIVPDLSKMDLSGANLEKANLEGTNLKEANLRGADLREANLREANLRGATLREADLRGANLGGATLYEVNLNGANLSEVELSGTIFGRATLNDANLSGADFSGMSLSELDLSGADLSRANLSGADLMEVDLSGGDLSQADLSQAELRGVNLSGANLKKTGFSWAILSEANLSGANLSGANLWGTDLSEADLKEADCRGVDFQQASLIDSHFDGANLTGAKLWETQRGGWSIKGIICQQAFWDRDGKEPTEYGDGDFERIFAEKPRIVLRYPGGMSPVDLAMLPLIVERLQAEHPDCALHIRSIQDDGNGATVTITVNDLAGRTDNAFNTDLVRLQAKLECVVEERDYYRQTVSQLFSPIKDRIRFPPQEIHVHHPSGLVNIEGTAMSRDTYNISGQAGAVGPNANAHDMIFHQIQNSLDLTKLAEELGQLRSAMKQEPEGTREQDKAIAAVAEAEEAAIKGDGRTALRHLKTAGKWALRVAEKISVSVAAEAIKVAIRPTAGL
jgi:uncharacterized protein YjbI with pentapeptide repeats